MIILFVILIIVASAVLGMIVLIQNPKGGGLAGNIAGFSSQFMGVKQTNDVLERGTWVFASIIAILCIVSVKFIKGGSSGADAIEIGTPPPASTPANTAPFQGGQQPSTTPPATP